ncbi:WD domain-containing protein [Xylariaceae sp. FL0804]|nr:WD domain-containing protein [Xylariaceae sp. FL0804]
MTSTPTQRLRLTPSNSPFHPRSARSPHRGRAPQNSDSFLSLKRVVGTTCASPTGFDTVQSSFAYIAGGAVVVVDVDGEDYSQRFYRARPTTAPVYNTPTLPYSTSTPSTPKANDSRNRVSLRESTYGGNDWPDSPTGKTWTSRERIKAATCVALSRDGRFLAVGETGYAPRVLIFSLQESSSDTPLVSISEHIHGVKVVAWSSDSRYLASLGSANDGNLYIWKIDGRTGAAKLFQQNRCTSYVRGMIWVGHNLITLGVRHVKIWRIEEAQPPSPLKQRFGGDLGSPAPPQKTLPGRNVLLGSMIESTFSCGAAIDDTRAIICSETGDVCLFDDTGKQSKLTHVLESGFVTTCVTVHKGLAYLGGKSGGFATLDLPTFITGNSECVQGTMASSPYKGLFAIGFLTSNMVTVDAKSTIHIWKQDHMDGSTITPSDSNLIPGNRDAVMGVESLPRPNASEADFYTWARSGQVVLWDINGTIKACLQMPLDEIYYEEDPAEVNQMTAIRAAKSGKYFIIGEKTGSIRIVDFSTVQTIACFKAHSLDCQFISTYEDESKFLIASCARDRTVQLFHRMTNGDFAHLQTVEFGSRVVRVLIPSADSLVTCSNDRTLQVHHLLSKDGDPDVMAAIPAKTLPLKFSPSSMTIAPYGKSVFVSLADRSVCLFSLESGKLSNTIKCVDENGTESVVLDSLISRPATEKEPAFLLGLSNTDKSIRIYNASGQFLHREWGHTEAINGVALVENDESTRKVVSVGSDGTIMIWEMDLHDRTLGPVSRDPSPAKDGHAVAQPTLRRVLSKAELADFQRSSPSPAGRRSPPRTITKRRSLYSLSSSSARTPVPPVPSSPSILASEDSFSRKTSMDSRSGSPPDSPKNNRINRRPSLPALNSTRPKSSMGGGGTTRNFGSLTMATEQACRTLRAYRKKLASSSEPIGQGALAELDQELRLTTVALGDRATRSQQQALSDSVLSGLLDQYSERLVSMLDEKLRLNSNYRPDDGPKTTTAAAAAADKESETALRARRGSSSDAGSSAGST